MNPNPCNVEAFGSAAGADRPTMIPVATSPSRQRRNEAAPKFDIYRADHVRLTSTQFGGGDWHWRLTGASGVVIADCGGYRNEAQCRAAAGAMRDQAGTATISAMSDCELQPSNGR